MHKITRRATSKGAATNSGLDSAEAGQHYASDRIHSSVTVGLAGRPERRRRKKSSLFVNKLKRRIELFLRRSALSRTALITSAAGVFLVAIVATLILATLFHFRLENVRIKESIKEKLRSPDFLAPTMSKVLYSKYPDSFPLTIAIPVATEKGVPPSLLVRLPPSFDIQWQKRTLRDSFEIVAFPPELNDDFATEGDFGGLEIQFFVEEGDKRNINYDSQLFKTKFRVPGTKDDDDYDEYYADDDVVRGPGTGVEESAGCRRISEHRLNLQTCNSVHEFAWLDMNVKYLNAGAYRQVVVLDEVLPGSTQKIIVKDLSYDLNVEVDNVEFVRMDAIVAERLTSSSLIYDIYGFCGVSILSEFFPHGDVEAFSMFNDNDGYIEPAELHDTEGVDPQNEIEPLEKLEISLQMAEGVATLHGYSGGVIVHNDVQPAQWLYNADKSIVKFNDFNRAEFLLWNDKKQDYCAWKNGKGHGNWRSPEEYRDEPLNEEIDVWSLGNNMYGLLTGLNPFYDAADSKKAVKRILSNNTAYIDPRWKDHSMAEGKLADIIPLCWATAASERVSIFEIVELLRDALKEVKEPKK